MEVVKELYSCINAIEKTNTEKEYQIVSNTQSKNNTIQYITLLSVFYPNKKRKKTESVYGQ